MAKRRALDPHKFVPAFASMSCIKCMHGEKHWLHRGVFYRMFHPRPGNVSTPRRR